MTTNWDRLIQLNGGAKIYYVEPRLDVKNQVWFYNSDAALVISSNGVLVKPKVAKGLGPVTDRATLYQVAKALVVDIEVRSEYAVVRRGVLNGSYVENVIAASDAPALLATYRKLGFRDGSPWHATPETRLGTRVRQRCRQVDGARRRFVGIRRLAHRTQTEVARCCDRIGHCIDRQKGKTRFQYPVDRAHRRQVRQSNAKGGGNRTKPTDVASAYQVCKTDDAVSSRRHGRCHAARLASALQ